MPKYLVECRVVGYQYYVVEAPNANKAKKLVRKQNGGNPQDAVRKSASNIRVKPPNRAEPVKPSSPEDRRVNNMKHPALNGSCVSFSTPPQNTDSDTA